MKPNRPDIIKRKMSARRIVFSRDKVCLRCGSKENLTLHHIARQGNLLDDTDPTNMIVMCKECHKNYHYDCKKNNYKINNKTLSRFLGKQIDRHYGVTEIIYVKKIAERN